MPSGIGGSTFRLSSSCTKSNIDQTWLPTGVHSSLCLASPASAPDNGVTDVGTDNQKPSSLGSLGRGPSQFGRFLFVLQVLQGLLGELRELSLLCERDGCAVACSPPTLKAEIRDFRAPPGPALRWVRRWLLRHCTACFTDSHKPRFLLSGLRVRRAPQGWQRSAQAAAAS